MLAFGLAAPAYGDGPVTPVPAGRTMSDPTSWTQRPPPGTTQAEQGAFTYWMRCMVCHGDRGQGLAVFRLSYPKQDQNCSASKCHGGPNPGAGFSFPDAPAIIGDKTLTRFGTAADLYAFVSTRMPYQSPGVLSSAEYWDVVGYLLKQHGALPAGVRLDAANAGAVPVHPQTGPRVNPLWLGAAALLLLPAGALAFALRRRGSHSG